MIRYLQLMALLFLAGCEASQAGQKQNSEKQFGVKQMQVAWMQGYQAAAPSDGAARIMAAELAIEQLMFKRSGADKLSKVDAALTYLVFRDRNRKGLPASCAKVGAPMPRYEVVFALKDQSSLYPSLTAIDQNAYPESEVASVQAFADAELELLAKSHGGDYKRTCAWLDEQPLLSPEMSQFSSAMPIIYRTLVPADEEQLKKSLGGF